VLCLSCLQHKMDIVLNIYDRWILTPYVYPKYGWPEDDPVRQLISLIVLVNIHAVILYFLLAGFSYFFLFDKQQMEHPLFLKVNDR
jgi:lathosterol oxidase